MADFPNASTLFQIARNEALAKNGRLSRDAFDRQGADANILAAAMAAVGDEVVGQLVDVAKGLYLDSAEGEQLDRLVFDRYGLIRKPASAALGSVQFTTATAAPAAFTIPNGTKLASSDGLQYATVGDSVFPLGSVGPIVVMVQSVLAGINQAAKAGTITSIVDQISGAPSTLAVVNTLATDGADDAESDDSLRARAQRFFSTARRGTMQALVAGALATPGVRTAQGFEVLDSYGRPARFVQLFISDAYTDKLAIFSTVPPAYEAQSAAIVQSVQNTLNEYRAAGMYVDVQVAQVVMQPILLQLQFQAGVDVNQTAYLARVAAVNYVNNLAPGAPIRVADLRQAVQRTPGILITGQEVASPPGDVVPKPLQVLRTSVQIVTALSQQAQTYITATLNPDSFNVNAS